MFGFVGTASATGVIAASSHSGGPSAGHGTGPGNPGCTHGKGAGSKDDPCEPHGYRCQSASAYPPGKCGEASEGRGETHAGATDSFGARDLRPGSNVNVYLDGTHTLLASGKADSSGNFVTTVRFPSHARAGQHEVILIGQNPNGSPSEFSAPITLDAAVRHGTVAAASSGQPLTDLSLAGLAAAAIAVLAGGGIVVSGRRSRSIGSPGSPGSHARGR